MDTWATSSLTPQIVGVVWPTGALRHVFPMALRPQAHEIIRTWAFYTIVRAHYHDGALPWRNIAISGWGLAPEGGQKLSKSRGGGPIGALAALDKYSADAVRYWAAGAGLGKDTIISEERIGNGNRWVTKLWNVARFAERFLAGYAPPNAPPTDLTTADRWLLARLAQITTAATAAFEAYDYATPAACRDLLLARSGRQLPGDGQQRPYAGRRGMSGTLHTLPGVADNRQLLAPLLPGVTEAISTGLLATARRRSPRGLADADAPSTTTRWSPALRASPRPCAATERQRPSPAQS
jgi:valyl-tRNA synthetase